MSKPRKVFAAKAIPVRLSPQTIEQVDKLAAELGEPRSSVLRWALRIGLKILTEPANAETLRGFLTVKESEAKTEQPRIEPSDPKKVYKLPRDKVN